MDEEFYNHLKYKQQIMKIGSRRKLPKMNGRTGQLPPLDMSLEGENESGEIEGGQESKRVLSF